MNIHIWVPAILHWTNSSQGPKGSRKSCTAGGWRNLSSPFDQRNQSTLRVTNLQHWIDILVSPNLIFLGHFLATLSLNVLYDQFIIPKELQVARKSSTHGYPSNLFLGWAHMLGCKPRITQVHLSFNFFALTEFPGNVGTWRASCDTGPYPQL